MTEEGAERGSLRNNIESLQKHIDERVNTLIDLSRRIENGLIKPMQAPGGEPMKEPESPEGLLLRIIDWQERTLAKLQGIVGVLDRVVKEIE